MSKYQVSYTRENSKVTTSIHEVVDLIPPTRKHIFTPDIDPSTLIDDEVIFKALTGINWDTFDFHMTGEDEESVQDDPESSTRQEQEN